MFKKLLLIVFATFLHQTVSTPLTSTTESLVILSTTTATNHESNENNKSDNGVKQPPKISEMDLKTNISNRFATTLVTSKVKNQNAYATEATFFIIIPDNAYISEFVMEIDGKPYKAYVKEKEEAKQIYNQAVQQGIGAAHVAVSARDSNKFTVSINIEPESKAIFYLTYQELLVRQKGQYELVLNINPGQIVKNLNVQVNINESRPITFVQSPSLRSGNEIGKNDEKLDPGADIVVNNLTAVVKFQPNVEKQKEYIKEFGTDKQNGLSAQFVVQYDVKRDPFGGEVLVRDGHFVHFFAPSDLPPLPKQVIFVLDTSGSMYGTKIDQLKQAMEKIISELKSEDSLSIVQFGSSVRVWDIATANYTELDFNHDDYGKLAPILSEKNIPRSLSASPENVKKAIDIAKSLDDTGATNAIGGLEVGLFLVNKDPKRKQQPIIVFLTDGQPNVGVSDPTKITELVTKINSGKDQVPIFSLSFGYGADRSFLEKLSLKNAGFARHIYEGADAALQLQEFYKLISSPLLKDITFKYTENAKQVTKRHYPIIFDGSELVVAGKTDDPKVAIEVVCFGSSGPINLTPVFEEPVDALEKLWAYLTVKNLLAEREIVDNKTEITKKALDLALKYSFVTSVTSLVVVKPNSTDSVNAEKADNPGNNNFGPVNRVLYAYGGVSFNAAPSSAWSTPSGGLTTFGKVSAHSQSFPIQPIEAAISSQEGLDIRVDSDVDSVPMYGSTTVTIPSWLDNILSANSTVTIPDKGTFELGNSANVTNHPKCPKTPLNDTVEGECTLVTECPQIYSYLTDLQALTNYFCPLENNKYLGVCCPKKDEN